MADHKQTQPTQGKVEKDGAINSEADIIIALVGPTGSGKTSFLNFATGCNKPIGHGLDSCTRDIDVVKFSWPERFSSDIFLVDTPGFDATNGSDVEVLEDISDWLNNTYQNNIRLSGILYFHRINDNRWTTSLEKNFKMFEKLVGNQFHNIVLATTMWDEIVPIDGDERERSLKKDFWKSMIKRGSSTKRFLHSKDSALEILVHLLKEPYKRETLLLQKEVTDLGLPLPQTSAGMELHSKLEQLVQHYQRTRDRMLGRLESLRGSTEEERSSWRNEYMHVQNKLQAVSNDKKAMESSVIGRLKRVWVTAPGGGFLARPLPLQDDMVIIVMGLTRAGKSTFINVATGCDPVIRYNGGLQPVTRDIETNRLTIHLDSLSGPKSLALLDTPGFNAGSFENGTSDAKLVDEIGKKIKDLESRNCAVRVLWIHDITDNCKYSSFEAFIDLYNVYRFKLLLVTSKWGTNASQSEAEDNERDLATANWIPEASSRHIAIWNDMVRGAKIKRFDKTRPSALEIVKELLVQDT